MSFRPQQSRGASSTSSSTLNNVGLSSPRRYPTSYQAPNNGAGVGYYAGGPLSQSRPVSTMAPMRPMNNDYFYDTASDYDDDDDDDYYQPSRAASYGYGNTARGRFNNGRRMLSFEYNDDDRSLSGGGGGGGRKRWTPTIGGVVFFGAIVAGAIVAAIWAKKNVKARLDVSVKRNKGASYSVFTAGSAQVPDNVPVSVYAFSRQVDPSFSPAVVDQLNDRSGSATKLVNQTYFPAGLNHPAMATTATAPRGAVDVEGAAQLQRLKQIEALRLQQQQAAAAKRAAAVAAAGGIPSSTGATSTTTSDVDIVIDEATASHLPRGLPNTSLLDEFVGGMNY